MLRTELQGAAVISGWVYNQKKKKLRQMQRVFERQEENETFVGLVLKQECFQVANSSLYQMRSTLNDND